MHRQVVAILLALSVASAAIIGSGPTGPSSTCATTPYLACGAPGTSFSRSVSTSSNQISFQVSNEAYPCDACVKLALFIGADGGIYVSLAEQFLSSTVGLLGPFFGLTGFSGSSASSIVGAVESALLGSLTCNPNNASACFSNIGSSAGGQAAPLQLALNALASGSLSTSQQYVVIAALLATDPSLNFGQYITPILAEVGLSLVVLENLGADIVSGNLGSLSSVILSAAQTAALASSINTILPSLLSQLSTGFLSLSGNSLTLANFYNAMSYVDGVLMGVSFSAGQSLLEAIDPLTGIATQIGAFKAGPFASLTYGEGQFGSDLLIGLYINSAAGTSTLYSLNRTTFQAYEIIQYTFPLTFVQFIPLPSSSSSSAAILIGGYVNPATQSTTFYQIDSSSGAYTEIGTSNVPLVGATAACFSNIISALEGQTLPIPTAQ